MALCARIRAGALSIASVLDIPRVVDSRGLNIQEECGDFFLSCLLCIWLYDKSSSGYARTGSSFPFGDRPAPLSAAVPVSVSVSMSATGGASLAAVSPLAAMRCKATDLFPL